MAAAAAGDTAAEDQLAGTGRPPVRSGALSVLVLVLVGAVLMNLVQHRGIDTRVENNNFDAVHRNHTADLTELAYTECGNCRDRYGIHLALHVIAPGSSVVVPRSGPYGADPHVAGKVVERLWAVGRVSTVEWVDEAPALATDPRPYVVASGPGGKWGAPWAIAIQRPAEVVGGPAGARPAADPDGFLAPALRDGRHHDPDGRPREFVLVAWPEPRGTYAYQDLLIERSLLQREPNP